MQAIIRTTEYAHIDQKTIPTVSNADDVLIRIAYAGLCRTDVYAANGLIDTKGERVLGHEFSGVVIGTGSDVKNVSLTDRVTVMPIMACGICELCQNGNKDLCQDSLMLGIDRDGAFAEYIVVPANIVYKLPDNVSFKQGAYSEPLAASLSVLKAGIKPEQKGVIFGENRFSHLISRILKVNGFEDVVIQDVESSTRLKDNTYDFVIETLASSEVMEQAFAAAKPKGTIILKSRRHDLVGINFNQAVRKELSIKAVNYADFDETLALLARDDFSIDDLFGESFALGEFKGVFKDAETNEGLKIFFAVNDDLVESDNVRLR